MGNFYNYISFYVWSISFLKRFEMFTFRCKRLQILGVRNDQDFHWNLKKKEKWKYFHWRLAGQSPFRLAGFSTREERDSVINCTKLFWIAEVMVFMSACNSVKFHDELLNYIDLPVQSIHGQKKQGARSATSADSTLSSRPHVKWKTCRVPED